MSDCSCRQCVRACETNPGWPTPEEAVRFIDDGIANKLMLDWLEPCDELGNEARVYVLAPASAYHEGLLAPECNIFSAFSLFTPWSKGRCVLLTLDSKCSVHDHKPTQCRLVMACGSENSNADGHPASNYEIARLWDSELGRSVVERWKDLVAFSDVHDDEE